MAVVGRFAGLAMVLTTLLPLAACAGSADQGDGLDAASVETPQLGACRRLEPADVVAASDTSRPVDCGARHTAQTYAVGDLPASLDDVGYDDSAQADFARQTCTEGFADFLGADAGTAMRSVLTWAWFRPTEEAWDAGARWYRCDVVGGSERSADLVSLPESARGLLQGRPEDRWMACVEGTDVDAGTPVPCQAPHDWRAVTTISLGGPDEAYPGDGLAEAETRGSCSESVQAWLNFPATFDYGYTWYQEAEWTAGNRRSVCWAKTVE